MTKLVSFNTGVSRAFSFFEAFFDMEIIFHSRLFVVFSCLCSLITSYVGSGSLHIRGLEDKGHSEHVNLSQ